MLIGHSRGYAAVMGGEGADAEVAADFVKLARLHGDERVRRVLPFDLPPA